MPLVEIVKVTGYRPGSRVHFPKDKAIIYVKNGQAKPVNWSLDEKDQKVGDANLARNPMNRMMDTSTSKEPEDNQDSEL